MIKTNKKISPREKLLAELKEIETEFKVAQQRFSKISQRSKTVVLKAKDKKKIDEIRRSIGL